MLRSMRNMKINWIIDIIKITTSDFVRTEKSIPKHLCYDENTAQNMDSWQIMSILKFGSVKINKNWTILFSYKLVIVVVIK